MWFGTRKGLSKYNLIDSTWQTFTKNEGLISNNIFDVKVDKQNNIWIATDDGLSKFSNIATEISKLPITNEIEIKISAYPNPFNPATTIEYLLTNKRNVKIEIYNSNGQLIELLVNDFKSEGIHNIIWNASNGRDGKVASGVYFLMLETNNHRVVQKILLLR